MTEPRRALLLSLVVLGLLALVPLTGEIFLTRLFTRVLIYALAAQSLDLILGVVGLVSFGHAAFFGLGAYVVGICAVHGLVDALIVWPLAIGAAAALALVIGGLALRTTGVAFIMITLAFAQMVFFLFASLRPYGADDGLSIWTRNTVAGFDPLSDHNLFDYVTLGLLALTTLFGRAMLQAPFGLVLRGIRQDERRMAALGFPTFRYKLLAFVLAGAMAGLAGALLANHTLYVSPQSLHWTNSGQLIVMVVMGGMGSLIGPILGAAALLLLEDALSARTQHWQVILGPFLILVVLFARRGLAGWLLGRPA
jgi:branched-chain amino acid transport system permease protein